MKKWLFATMVGVSLLAARVDASPTLITLNELTQEALNDWWMGKFSDAILEFPAGSLVPLKLSVEGDLLTLEGTASTSLAAHINKTFYLKYEGGYFYFSTDLLQWRMLTDFVTGTLGAQLCVDNGVPTLGVGLEVNQRQ